MYNCCICYTKKYITFYSQIQFEEESKWFTNKMRINRETGEMEHFKGTPYEKDKYEAYCDKISFNDLPLELVKQKF